MNTTSRPPILLIIDDNITNLSVLTQYLHDQGLQIMIARNGESGLTKARKGRPDLILLDVLMPGIDGFETCRRLKADSATADVPVIFMTALQSVEDKVKAFAAGGVDLISKPLHKEEVLARVRTHVQLYRQQKVLQREIAERRQAEAKLREREALYRQMFHEHSAIKLVIDPSSGRILEANPAAAQFYGYPINVLQSMSIEQINTLPPETLIREMAAALARECNRFEFQHRLASGELRDVEIHSTPITLNGRPLLYSIIHDITERKQAEVALRESEAHLKIALETLQAGVWEHDLATGRVIWDARTCELFGLAPDSGEMTISEAFSFIHPDDLAVKLPVFQQAITTEDTWEDEYRYIRADGSIHWIYAACKIFRDDAGKAVRMLGINFDITERKQSEVQLQKAKDAAEAASRAKSSFLANMSHELRTPLNMIIGFSQILTHDENLTQDQLNHLGIIKRSGEHLLTLINSVLDMAKIESGRTTLSKTDFNLYGLLFDIEALFRMQAKNKGLYLRFERTPDVPKHIMTDSVKLRQVLINIIGNALKFTHEGGIVVKVAPHGKTTLLFSVEDTGPGITEDEFKNIFEPFAQTETGRMSREGTGLGLPISQKFVQLMGGDIKVDSTPGVGTIFTFNIRIRPADAPDIRRSQSISKVIGLEPGQPVFRILIVDDHVDNRHLLVKLLSPLGFDIREAENGQKAVEIWEQWKPHLIWMDIHMPVMDGYKAAGKIRKQMAESGKNKAPDFPIIIAISTDFLEDEYDIAVSSGCNDFMCKPFREHDIYDRMHRHLGIKFIYETVQEGEGKVENNAELMTKLEMSEAITGLPEKMRTDFLEVSEKADFDNAVYFTDKIRQHNSMLADELLKLINGFRFDLLIKLFSGETRGKTDA